MCKAPGCPGGFWCPSGFDQPTMAPCASDLFPQAALDAMVAESGTPRHDDGHTDCYYAGLLLAALPHLITGEMVERGLSAARVHWTAADEDDVYAILVAALAMNMGQKDKPIRMPAQVLTALKVATDAHPDQRVMQVIVNALGTDPFNVEDCDAIGKLYDYAASGEGER
jgi:hypothetical protein